MSYHHAVVYVYVYLCIYVYVYVLFMYKLLILCTHKTHVRTMMLDRVTNVHTNEIKSR